MGDITKQIERARSVQVLPPAQEMYPSPRLLLLAHVLGGLAVHGLNATDVTRRAVEFVDAVLQLEAERGVNHERSISREVQELQQRT